VLTRSGEHKTSIEIAAVELDRRVPHDLAAGWALKLDGPAGDQTRCGQPAPAPGTQRLPGALGLVGIGDRPGEPLDQLLCRVIVAEVDRVDLLIEQHRGLVEKCRAPPSDWVRRDDDSGHF
jgi:hypothetical protein